MRASQLLLLLLLVLERMIFASRQAKRKRSVGRWGRVETGVNTRTGSGFVESAAPLLVQWCLGNGFGRARSLLRRGGHPGTAQAPGAPPCPLRAGDRVWISRSVAKRHSQWWPKSDTCRSQTMSCTQQAGSLVKHVASFPDSAAELDSSSGFSCCQAAPIHIHLDLLKRESEKLSGNIFMNPTNSTNLLAGGAAANPSFLAANYTTAPDRYLECTSRTALNRLGPPCGAASYQAARNPTTAALANLPPSRRPDERRALRDRKSVMPELGGSLQVETANL